MLLRSSELRNRSVSGGLITVIAGTTAFLLFLGQIYNHLMGRTHHTLHLSDSTSITMLPTDTLMDRKYHFTNKLPVTIDITFPYIPCTSLEIKLNNGPLPEGTKIQKRVPNSLDLRKSGFADLINNKQPSKGCNIKATKFRVPVVAGHITITMTKKAWLTALQQLMTIKAYNPNNDDNQINNNNMTHYIHQIRFGVKRYPSSSSGGQLNDPLDNKLNIIENNMGGIALENIQVKLVPTKYNGFFKSYDCYQVSVVNHAVHPETMIAQGGSQVSPGLAIAYDLTPLAVHHIDERDSLLVFLSSLISIVSGVFVTVGLFTGCLVHSAKTVAKKID